MRIDPISSTWGKKSIRRWITMQGPQQVGFWSEVWHWTVVVGIAQVGGQWHDALNKVIHLSWIWRYDNYHKHPCGGYLRHLAEHNVDRSTAINMRKEIHSALNYHAAATESRISVRILWHWTIVAGIAQVEERWLDALNKVFDLSFVGRYHNYHQHPCGGYLCHSEERNVDRSDAITMTQNIHPAMNCHVAATASLSECEPFGLMLYLHLWHGWN